MNLFYRETILALGLALMLVGARIDKQRRKYPNKIVLLSSIVGLLYAYMCDRVMIGVCLCLAFHVAGILDGFMLRLVKPGDWKMFATVPLYLPLENMTVFMIYAIILVSSAVVTKILNLKNINWTSIKECFKQEKDAMTCLLVLKEHMNTGESMFSLYKEKTIPMTVLFVFACIATQIYILVI